MCGSSSGRVGVWWASASLAQANHGLKTPPLKPDCVTHLQQAANAMRASAFAASAGFAEVLASNAMRTVILGGQVGLPRYVIASSEICQLVSPFCWTLTHPASDEIAWLTRLSA